MEYNINYFNDEHILFKIEGLACEIDNVNNYYIFEITNMRIIIYRIPRRRKETFNVYSFYWRDVVYIEDKPNIVYRDIYEEKYIDYSFNTGYIKLSFSDENEMYVDDILKKSMYCITGKEEMIEPIVTRDEPLFSFGRKKKEEKKKLEAEQKEKKEDATNVTAQKCMFCGAPISGMKGTIVTCSYCDSVQQI